MGKALGIGLMVVALWAGLEIYTEGTQGAFGGLFQELGLSEAPATDAPESKPLEALRLGVGEDMDIAEAKRRRALGE